MENNNNKNVEILKWPEESKNVSESYRPMSLLSAIWEIAEKIIYRVEKVIEENKIFLNWIIGFRKVHGTSQQILRITMMKQ